MRSTFPWARTLAIVLFLFALGHTVGTAAPHVTRGTSEATVFAVMQRFRFPVMGFERSYWDFYRGFALSISVYMFTLAAVAWQLQRIVNHDPRRALPVAVTLLLCCLATAMLCWLFFFGAPIVFAMVAVVCAGMLVSTLVAARGVEPS